MQVKTSYLGSSIKYGSMLHNAERRGSDYASENLLFRK